MKIKQQVTSNASELVALYRDFHAHPELGFQEFRSQKKVSNYRANLGLKPRKRASTGVVTKLKSTNPGPTILLRTDMDTIPVTEETGFLTHQKSLE